ncbi:hypothetical protein PDG61_11095 [Mycolicibacterium sp. BiH015]|uniref:hypothetical protein n=1 Tax=Mycolicibacterium sp. BiH015 TaxID=3018808 RepID=UPI0022E42AF9|nr:hypothetical protein [Mycolicibacterium sp. BiH015]MDA2891458.1 hypothetical protein [Mycolicibacterium sp. BiH015]
MQSALRPYLTAGVALVGASVIAVNPVTPAPEVLRNSHEVSLAAISNPTDPFVAYPEAVTNTFTNLALLGGALLEWPAPILQAFVEAQLSYGAASWDATLDTAGGLAAFAAALPIVFQTAVTQLIQGQVGPAILTLAAPAGALFEAVSPLVDLAGTVVGNVAQNIANVVKVLTNPAVLTALVTGLAAPVNSVIAAIANQTQLTIDAITSGDLVKAVGAVVSTPAVLADAFINGFDPVNENLRGVINGTVVTFIVLRNAVADAIVPLPAPVLKVSEIPDQEASFVELQLAAASDQSAALPPSPTDETGADTAGEPEAETAGELEDVDPAAEDAETTGPAENSVVDDDDIPDDDIPVDEDVATDEDLTGGETDTPPDEMVTSEESESAAPDAAEGGAPEGDS